LKKAGSSLCSESQSTPLFQYPAKAALATLQLVPLLEDRFGAWKPVSRVAGIGWLCFYALFLLYAALDRSGFLFLDYVNLIIHEGGHLFFAWFGETLMILGGTLGELLVPLLCAAYFFFRRETTGFAFCSFWFFENFPYIGTYMSDARDQALPLFGGGEHDWGTLFAQWGVLQHDRTIGGVIRDVGWIGMFVTVIWLAYRVRHDAAQSNVPKIPL
jgi:hypothetical protein